jgi:hypothetical protein
VTTATSKAASHERERSAPSKTNHAGSVGAALWAQILRAITIALAAYLGISFPRSFMRQRAGAPAAPASRPFVETTALDKA